MLKVELENLDAIQTWLKALKSASVDPSPALKG